MADRQAHHGVGRVDDVVMRDDAQEMVLVIDDRNGVQVILRHAAGDVFLSLKGRERTTGTGTPKVTVNPTTTTVPMATSSRVSLACWCWSWAQARHWHSGRSGRIAATSLRPGGAELAAAADHPE